MENETNTNKSSYEVDFIEVIRYIWEGRWLIVKVIFIFVIVGIVIAFTSQKEYRAEARILPEIRDTQGGASQLLRQLGGIGGLSVPLGQGTDAIRPNLYPDVLRSTPFFIYLMGKDVLVKSDAGFESMNILAYMDQADALSFSGILKKYTIRLPWTIIGWFRGTDSDENTQVSTSLGEISQITMVEFNTIKKLRNRINASINQRSGVISISAEFPDPEVAAQIGQYTVNYITDYITDYRIEKAQKDFEFIKERYEDKKKEFYQAQLALANFRDANRNIVSATVQTEEQRLQDQYNLVFNVYNSLAQQLEQARIKVQEETPVIKILDPVQVPIIRSAPRRSLILVVSALLGGFFGVGLVFGKKIWSHFGNQIMINNNEH